MMTERARIPSVGDPTALLMWGAFCVLVYVIYHPMLSFLLSRWNREDHNYCYLIPFVVLYLIWEKRAVLRASASRPSWKGVWIVLGALGFFWIGELGGEYFTLYLSFWGVIFGWTLLLLGWKKTRHIMFPLVFALTMFPLPNYLIKKMTLKLQIVSSQLGVSIMRTSGLSAFREGNVIDLGFTQLQVVEACSGLRFLIPLFILSILMAYFYKAAWWKRCVIVLTAIPLSIVTNSLRIALTGILYESWGPRVAEGFFHGFSGWLIFMFSMAVLMAEMWMLTRIARGGKGHKATAGSGNQKGGIGCPGTEKGDSRGGFADDSSGSGDLAMACGPPVGQNGVQSQKDIRAPERSVGRGFVIPLQVVVAMLMLGGTLSLAQGVEFREKIPMKKAFSAFPLDVDGFRGIRQTLQSQFLQALDLSEYLMVDYKNADAENINLYVAYYESQRKGESIHSPATCLPGGGWDFNQAGTRQIALPDAHIKVNRAVMQLGEAKQIVYYWFPARGRILTNAYQLKLYTFWDALTRQRTDGALVRVITPVYGNGNVNDAEKRLEAFVKKIVPILDEFLPE